MTSHDKRKVCHKGPRNKGDISQISQSRVLALLLLTPQGLTYKQMDGRSMELPDANFNVVIDKVNEWSTSGQRVFNGW